MHAALRVFVTAISRIVTAISQTATAIGRALKAISQRPGFAFRMIYGIIAAISFGSTMFVLCSKEWTVFDNYDPDGLNDDYPANFGISPGTCVSPPKLPQNCAKWEAVHGGFRKTVAYLMALSALFNLIGFIINPFLFLSCYQNHFSFGFFQILIPSFAAVFCFSGSVLFKLSMDDITADTKANESGINFHGTVSYGMAVIIVVIVVHLANVALFFTGIIEARAARSRYRLQKSVIARQKYQAKQKRELADWGN